MSLRVYTTAAVVLHRINLGENDKILTLYTRDRGKLSAVAKGARKPLSKLAGATDLFTHSRMQLAVGRSLDVVTQAEIVDPFQRIRADLERIAYASLMVEMIDRFVEERDPQPRLFVLLGKSLRALEQNKQPELSTLLYQAQLLAALGYQPRTETCVACGAAVVAAPASFSATLGGALCREHRRAHADAISVHPAALSLAALLLKIAPGDREALDALAPHAASGVRHDLTKLFSAHIRYHLERPIKSLDFVHEVQAMYTAKTDQGQ